MGLSFSKQYDNMAEVIENKEKTWKDCNYTKTENNEENTKIIQCMKDKLKSEDPFLLKLLEKKNDNQSTKEIVDVVNLEITKKINDTLPYNIINSTKKNMNNLPNKVSTPLT